MRFKWKFIGEYKEIDGVDTLPSIYDAINEEPYPEKETVLNYLKSAEVYFASGRTDNDIFSHEIIPGYSCGYTDGTYAWSSVLIYYLEKYNLRLPQEFIDYVFGKAANG